MSKVVTFGEIMLRLATPDHLRFSQSPSLEATFGGGEANVAVSLSKFGIESQFMTRLPGNDIAQSAIGELNRHGVCTKNIIRGGERVGIYFLETGAVNRPSKVVYDRAHSSISTIEPGMVNWDEVLCNASWFHITGITPALSQSAADTSLEAMKAAKRLGLTVSMDLNYRKNLWKYGKSCTEVMPQLVELTDIVIANEEDAEKVLGIKPEGFDAAHTAGHIDASHFENVAAQIMAKFPGVKQVAITLRGSINADHNTWGAMLYDGKRMYTSPRYDITHIVDRVGGGDSFGAGLIYALISKPEDKQYAINFAVAASALKHTIKGDFNLTTLTEVETLMGGDGSGRVSR